MQLPYAIAMMKYSLVYKYRPCFVDMFPVHIVYRIMDLTLKMATHNDVISGDVIVNGITYEIYTYSHNICLQLNRRLPYY